MTDRIVYSPASTSAISNGDHERKEVWDFARAGTAARVPEDSPLIDEDDGGIEHVDRADRSMHARIVESGVEVAETDTASIEEIRALHSIPPNESPRAGDPPMVVVVDTGLDPTHPVFADTTVRCEDFTGDGPQDGFGHGTAVAGQIARIAPEATIVSLRVLSANGSGSMSDILSAYEWIYQHANEIDVVNMSLGFPDKVPTIDRIHNEMIAQGVRDTVAAGNTGGPGGSPATATRAFSMGACNVDGDLASFSSYDSGYDNPDVTAVGANCRMAQAENTTMGRDLDGPFVAANGTSFAAPIGAGVIARYLNRGIDPTQSIPRTFEEHADDVADTPRDGAGVLDYTGVIDDATTTTAHVYSLLNQNNDSIYLESNWLPAGQLRAELIDADSPGTTITFVER